MTVDYNGIFIFTIIISIIAGFLQSLLVINSIESANDGIYWYIIIMSILADIIIITFMLAICGVIK